MARRRFFVPQIRRGTAELTGPEAEHLARVLRVEPGQIYEISDNQDLYLAEIEVARKSAVSFRVLERLELPGPSVRIVLLAALIKFDRFEWLIEKATELGVTIIQPVDAVRTERGLAEASIKRLVRWRKVALEASQQSRRVHLPAIERTVPFAQAVHVKANVQLLLDESPQAPLILQMLPQERTATDCVALLSGPEGGWTEAERRKATGSGWSPCSLGKTVLRAETAALAALAVIQAAWHSR